MTRGNFLTIHFSYFGENAFAFARESSFTSRDYMTPANISRFGIKGSGLTYEGKFNWANWTRPVENWVCGYEPYLGVVIYDCIPSDKVFSFFYVYDSKLSYKVPLWWDDVYMGPNFDDGEVYLGIL